MRHSRSWLLLGLMGLAVLAGGCSVGSSPVATPTPTTPSEARVVIDAVTVRKHASTPPIMVGYDWQVVLVNRGTADGRVKVEVCAPASYCQTSLGESPWTTVRPGATVSLTGGVPQQWGFPNYDQATVRLWGETGVQGSVLLEEQSVLIH